ncbi:MAG: hypothetical protein ACTSP4_05090, partial [Candidatus Hodarchaeales archaeon]
KFGPWYGWNNADLGLFRQSVEKIREFVKKTEVEIIIPSHSRAVNKDEGLVLLDRFHAIFDDRRKRILNYIGNSRNGVTIDEIADQSFIYKGKVSNPPFVWKLFEKIHVESMAPYSE